MLLMCVNVQGVKLKEVGAKVVFVTDEIKIGSR